MELFQNPICYSAIFTREPMSASTLAVVVTTRHCVGTMGTAPLQVCVSPPHTTPLHRGVFASMNTHCVLHRYLAPEMQFGTSIKMVQNKQILRTYLGNGSAPLHVWSLVILSIVLTAIKMLPNNHKIAHNIVQTTILFTFYPLLPHAYCAGTVKIYRIYVVFTNIQ